MLKKTKRTAPSVSLLLFVTSLELNSVTDRRFHQHLESKKQEANHRLPLQEIPVLISNCKARFTAVIGKRSFPVGCGGRAPRKPLDDPEYLHGAQSNAAWLIRAAFGVSDSMCILGEE